MFGSNTSVESFKIRIAPPFMRSIVAMYKILLIRKVLVVADGVMLNDKQSTKDSEAKTILVLDSALLLATHDPEYTPRCLWSSHLLYLQIMLT